MADINTSIDESIIVAEAAGVEGWIDYLAEIDAFDVDISAGTVFGDIDGDVTGAISSFEVVMSSGVVDATVDIDAGIMPMALVAASGEVTDGRVISEWVYLSSPISVMPTPTAWGQKLAALAQPDNDAVIFTGDTGTALLVDCGVDLSGAINPRLRVRKPDGSIAEWNASVVRIGKELRFLQYLIQPDDLPHAGTYYLQAYLSIGEWAGYGGKSVMRVNQNIYGDVI
jgi:hypothetical protein